ncbi:MAG: hypothetical protein E5V89_01920 [Mesorhizobium sp.]|nr:MAG: hypothetical protein E5V89_01920 [Mesorhizobium sp.]
MRLVNYALVASATIFITTPSLADPTKGDATNLIGKLGGTAAKTYLSQKPQIKIPPSTLPVDQQNTLMESTLTKYGEIRNTYYAAANAGQTMGLSTEAFFGLAALRVRAPLAARVGLLLMGAVTKSITDAGNEKILATGREKGRQYLAEQKSAILKEAGVNTFSDLRSGRNVQQIKEILTKATDNFKDVRDRAQGDDILANHAQDLLLDTIANTEPEILDAIQVQGDQIAAFTGFVKEMKDYTEATDEKLQAHAAAIVSINEKVNELSGTIEAVNEELRRQGRDQAIVSDFIFDEMPPRKKADSLRAGFLKERFTCPTETPDCKAPELREKLISQFDREADIQEFVGAGAQLASGLNDLNTIASNFGIDSPELNKAAEIGNAAMGAVTAYFSGNPLGAVSAVSSLFGQKKDPNAATMQFLKQIDRKLDIIIENQKILLEAVNRLSEQVQKGFEAVDNRLDRMEFEQRRMSQGVRELIWKNWRSCYSVVEEARKRETNGNYAYIDPVSETFTSFDHIKSVWRTTGQAFRDCLITVTNDMSSLSAVQYFGNFIDAQWAIDDRIVPDGGTLQNPKEGDEWKSLLQRYEGDLFTPALEVSSNYADKLKIGRASSFALLATPAAQITQLESQLKERIDTPFVCFKANARDERLYSLLCGRENPDQTAAELLARPILADLTIDIANWVTLLAAIADVYNQQDQRFYETIDEVLAESGAEPAGKGMIEKSIRVLDVAVAAYDQLYGGFTALAVIDTLDALKSATDQEKPALTAKAEVALRLLNNNPYLAENVSSFLLKRNAIAVSDYPLTEEVYREAYDFAQKGGARPGFLFEGLFSGLQFTTSEIGTPSIRLVAGSVTADIQLPPPHQFIEGRMIFPPRFYELINTRMMLFDRLFDYNVLKYVGSDERDDLAAQILQ